MPPLRVSVFGAHPGGTARWRRPSRLSSGTSTRSTHTSRTPIRGLKTPSSWHRARRCAAVRTCWRSSALSGRDFRRAARAVAGLRRGLRRRSGRAVYWHAQRRVPHVHWRGPGHRSARRVPLDVRLRGSRRRARLRASVLRSSRAPHPARPHVGPSAAVDRARVESRLPTRAQPALRVPDGSEPRGAGGVPRRRAAVRVVGALVRVRPGLVVAGEKRRAGVRRDGSDAMIAIVRVGVQNAVSDDRAQEGLRPGDSCRAKGERPHCHGECDESSHESPFCS